MRAGSDTPMQLQDKVSGHIVQLTMQYLTVTPQCPFKLNEPVVL